ncbi:MAG: serine/threonine protein kinase [Myxococcales bacterium]|nr:serine/threonine protein kinase [Myxococcales bacterium]
MIAPATQRPDQDLPQVFGRYLLLKRLSRGGMGEIFLGKLGEIQGFEKPVIIKKILPNLSADDEFIKRFIDEAQVAIKLNHANIAPVFEVGKVDGDYFLALEYIEGRDLRRLITRSRDQRARLPPDLCLFVARELVSGLGYAHRRTDTEGSPLALVHCDISPPNVMVSFEGEVKVIDFGIAKSAIRIAGSNPNMGFGKFGYMAPEQLVRGGIVDRRTDIYAAGVVLYELLTGERLFIFTEGADYKQIARIVTRGEFTPVSRRDPRLDPSLDPIVGKALAPRAEDRYQTAEEFRDALQQKLYQMNPTISGDALAAYMRRLFADEIEEERALIASARAVDIEEFQDQLTGSATHTVTFARARQFEGEERPESERKPVVESSLSIHARKNGVVALAAAGAMIAGGYLVFLIATRGSPPPPPPAVLVARSTPAPEVAPPVVAPPPVVASPVVTPLPPAAKAGDGPKLNKVKKIVAGLKVAKVEEVDLGLPTKRSHESVEAKFRTVKHEYDGFKGEYGARLESQWNAITSEMVFGKGDTKYDKLDAMLDTLRREMGKVRSGG